jgi:hypothetical protein
MIHRLVCLRRLKGTGDKIASATGCAISRRFGRRAALIATKRPVQRTWFWWGDCIHASGGLAMSKWKLAIPILAAGLAFSQTKPRPGVEVQMIVTVADHINHHPGPLTASDLRIMDATITEITPFGRGHDLDVFILIDDAANYEFGSKLKELREFVTTQPPAEAIGVAYIHDGTLQVAENPTTDHARAASALRVPVGSKAANPYCALSDLMQRWPGNSPRHAVVLISTGLDDSTTEGVVCVNAQTAIHDAERSGTTIFALYNPLNNYESEKWSKVDAGVAGLAHVSYESGGEAYFLGHTPLDSIMLFLDDIAEHLDHQYLVKFRTSPGATGEFRSIYVNPSTSPGRALMKPESVWVPGVADLREH